MKQYLPRIIDQELTNALKAAGAVLIKGPKACGKTQTAMRQAASTLHVDQDERVSEIMAIDPTLLLNGDTPRLIDEWQLQPKLWNYVRHDVDERGKKGQFILTGSANPDTPISLHSGAGRFIILPMRTLSWLELGYSDGSISLKDLFTRKKIAAQEQKLSIQEIARRLIIGGWPSLVGVDEKSARKINNSYIKLLAEVDMSKIAGIKRDPVKVRFLLQSIARNVSTITEMSTFIKDIEENNHSEISRPTVSEYLDTLEKLMITEDQPAWNAHIRSSASLRKTPKRHFTDPSLAAATLGLDSQALLGDLRYTGFLFESQVIHDLRIYAQTFDAEVFYYRDSLGLEVDAIVQKPNGDCAVFEIKLGEGAVETGVNSLKAFANNIIPTQTRRIVSLNIITGSGYAYTRPDNINVIPISALGI